MNYPGGLNDAYGLQPDGSLMDPELSKARKRGPITPDDGDESVCAVCQEKLTDPETSGLDGYDTDAYTREVDVLRSSCNHCFHTNCLAKWVILFNRTRCPICTTTIEQPDVDAVEAARPELARPEYAGVRQIFEGDHLVRVEFPSGNVAHFEGLRGEEHRVRQEFANGTVEHYEGPAGQEHLVRVEYADGDVEHYEGPAGEEHLVRTELPDGVVEHYEGPAGQEHLVRTELPDDGQVNEHSDGEEHLVRTEFPDDGQVNEHSDDAAAMDDDDSDYGSVDMSDFGPDDAPIFETAPGWRRLDPQPHP